MGVRFAADDSAFLSFIMEILSFLSSLQFLMIPALTPISSHLRFFFFIFSNSTYYFFPLILLFLSSDLLLG